MSAADETRFVALLQSHQKILYKIVNGYCRQPADRDDLLQEIVIAGWQSFARFDERVRFSTWLYRVAMNVAISFYRRERRRQQHHVPLPATLDFAAADRAMAAAPDELQRLYAAIRELPDLDRALVLLYLDEQSHDEIALALGLTVTNVSTRLSRIKQKLKEQTR